MVMIKPMYDPTDQFDYGKRVKAIGRKIVLTAMLLGAAALIGYALNIEFLYRPLENEPATNALTALLVMLLALGLEASNRTKHKYIPIFIVMIVTTICVIHIADLINGTEFSNYFLPFKSAVDQDLILGNNNSMGLNTTFMLLLLAVSHLLYIYKFPLSSQLLSFTALCIPMVSIIGYAYGLTSFYGSMSLLSTTFGVFLCVGSLAITADKGGVRAILSPYIGGRIARTQFILGCIVPLVLGYLVIRSLANSDQNSIFGIYVIAIFWFIALLVVVSAIVQEQVDGKRRDVETALQRSATIDELTQLPNRRYFMEAAKQKMATSQSTSWFLMVDIDHFKKINDNAGHGMGDKVLIEFSRILNDFIGPEDLICRLGGEEFAILLSNRTKDAAEKVSEEMLQAIAAMNIPEYTDVYGGITTSIGCTSSLSKTDVDHALKSADKALYQSKNTGRNRVSFLL